MVKKLREKETRALVREGAEGLVKWSSKRYELMKPRRGELSDTCLSRDEKDVAKGLDNSIHRRHARLKIIGRRGC